MGDSRPPADDGPQRRAPEAATVSERPSARAEAPTHTADTVDVDAAPPPPDALPVGTRAGRYVLVEHIGAGGAGQVYAAYDPQLHRRVAIKLLRAAKSGSISATQADARLLREGQAMARLKHPNVLPVYDLGALEYDGKSSVFVAMELVEGGTLRQWLRKSPRTRREILGAMIAAGRGLAAAHAARLVHRDFKPDNVLVDDDGRVYVTDFGIVRAARDSGDGERAHPQAGTRPTGDLMAAPLTRMDAIVGSPGYMAPEQYRGGPVDERTDQFSFCVTLFEALTGERPFGGESFGELMDATTHGRVPAAAASTMPAWLRRVVLRGLSRDPAQRFASMNELLAALEKDPALRTRRLLVVAAAVAAVVASALAAAGLASRNRELCRGSERRLAGAWDPTIRSAVARAFAASGARSGDALAATTMHLLDDYAARWAAMRTDACEATRVRGEQPESLLQLRMTCLDDRLHELGALTGSLAHADAALVDKSIDAVSALSSLSRCADAAALTAPVPPPADDKTRQTVAALRRRVVELKALSSTGKAAPLLPESEALVKQARQLGYGPVLAQTLQVRADLYDDSGAHKDAERLLFEAFAVAYGAHDDARAADVADDLVTVDGYWLAHAASGHRWADLCRAAIRRIGGDAELEAWVARDEAWVDYLAGDAARAVADAERALELAGKAFAPDSTIIGKIRQALAAAYSMEKRYDEAIAEGQRAVAILARNYGPDHVNVAAVLNTIGNAARDKGQLADAERFFRRALAILEPATGPMHPKVAITRSNLGEVQLDLHHYADALSNFEAALPAGDKLGADHPVTFHALVGIGEAELALARPARATAPLERAVALADRAGLPAEQRGLARFALARALWESGGSRERARALADRARGEAVAAKDDEVRASIDAWLKARSSARR